MKWLPVIIGLVLIFGGLITMGIGGNIVNSANPFLSNSISPNPNFGQTIDNGYAIYHVGEIIALVGLIALIAGLIVPRIKANQSISNPEALKILDERLAKGEINQKEYKSLRRNLKR